METPLIFNSYILNIDVLGFGTFVERNSAQTVFDYYGRIITGAAFAGDIVDKDNLDVMVYSDTIAIKSNNEDERVSLFNLVKIANIIQVGQYYSALSKDAVFLPVRGTITFGEFFFHKGDIWSQAPGREKIYAKNVDMIIGKPIVESHELEKSMELMCVAIGDSAQCRAKGKLTNHLLDSNLLLEYEIPIKKRDRKKGLIVNPVSTPHLDVNVEKLKHECKKHEDCSSTKHKYLNTIDLFEFVKTNRKFYPKSPE